MFRQFRLTGLFINNIIILQEKSCFSTYRNFSNYLSKMKGIVLGVYNEPGKTSNEVSSVTSAFTELDKKSDGQLSALVKGSGPFSKSVKQKLLWTPMMQPNLGFDCVCVVNLGSKEEKNNPLENVDQKSENVRTAVANGVKALRAAADFEDIFLDDCHHPQSAAEAATLVLFCYDELKSEKQPSSNLSLYKHKNISDDHVKAYERGVLLAECQNFQRKLMETPANLMTPTIFSETVEKTFKDKNVKVIIREREWAEEKGMHSFLSVSNGSDQKPKFVELHYEGVSKSDKCIALVGKGITFDSGGISLKPSLNMHDMRADMGGAACVVATMLAVSSMGLKINLKCFIPLSENLPNGSATKPGDVVRAMNGKTIQIDNTDAEGRLVLCDALCYAQQFKPMAIVDIATLTGAIRVALGEAATGAYCNDDHLWEILNAAGFVTGDRMWRMPLYKVYRSEMKECDLADINNIGAGRLGGSCTAAGFLSDFIEDDVKWIHLDIAGVMGTKGKVPYLNKGMTGRPLRTVVEFVKQLESKF